MRSRKAEKRAVQIRKQQELEERLSAPARGTANAVVPVVRVEGFWNSLPLPFLARLFHFLTVPEIQRCLTLFRWPEKALLQFTKGRFIEYSKEQREHPFSSERLGFRFLVFF
jgi:hypothetical protein